MAMELFIFSDRQLNSIAEWQSAIDREGYPLKLDEETEFGNLQGFLPMSLEGQLTGFECYHDPADEVMQGLGEVPFDHAWKYCFGFRWLGSKELEMLASWMAATAYAAATGGVIADEMTIPELMDAAQARSLLPRLIKETRELFGTSIQFTPK